MDHDMALRKRIWLLAAHRAARTAYREARRGVSWELRAELSHRANRLRAQRTVRMRGREARDRQHAAEMAYRGPGRMGGR